MTYDKKIYLELLSKNKFDKADSYRANNMPKSLLLII